MADVRISQLNESLPLSGGEYIPITQLGADGKLHTVYTTPETIASYVIARASSKTTTSNSAPVTSSDVIPIIAPVGGIMPFAGDISNANSVPAGWLVCDGTAVSKTTYSALYAVIGDKFGSATDTSMFKLPDIRYRVIMGYNTVTPTAVPGFGNWISSQNLAVGSIGGEFNNRLSVDEIPSHTHTYYDAYGANDDQYARPNFYDIDGKGIAGFQSWWGGWKASGVDSDSDGHNIEELHRRSEAAGGNGYHNNMQPYICMNYIIKH